MSRSVCSLAIAAICAGSVLSSGQVHSSTIENKSAQNASPAAYVYVSNVSSAGSGKIDGFVASSSGVLSVIPGAPFPYNVNFMAANGQMLFGVLGGRSLQSGQVIGSFYIKSDGALSYETKENVSESGGGVIGVYLDRTGSSLYADYYTINNDYLAYNVQPSTGTLSFVNTLLGGPPNNSPVSFIGSDQFAYSSACYHYMPDIYGVVRASDGALSYLSMTPPFPAEKSGGFYCPALAAADAENHVAIAMQPLTQDWTSDGPWQLATYSADSAGNLTTTSTYSNMPGVAVGTVNDYKMAPSGKLLAVAGTGGLQLFQFNGGNPITSLTGSLTSDSIDQVAWDTTNHVYAISRSSGRLHVFVSTSKGVSEAAGSPYAIAGIENLVVVPR